MSLCEGQSDKLVFRHDSGRVGVSEEGGEGVGGVMKLLQAFGWDAMVLAKAITDATVKRIYYQLEACKVGSTSEVSGSLCVLFALMHGQRSRSMHACMGIDLWTLCQNTDWCWQVIW